MYWLPVLHSFVDSCLPGKLLISDYTQWGCYLIDWKIHWIVPRKLGTPELNSYTRKSYFSSLINYAIVPVKVFGLFVHSESQYFTTDPLNSCWPIVKITRRAFVNLSTLSSLSEARQWWSHRISTTKPRRQVLPALCQAPLSFLRWSK